MTGAQGIRSARAKPGLVKEITSPANPIIKQIKGLALKKNRDSEGLFIAEGLKLVTDALDADWQIDTLIYAKQMQEQPHLQAVSTRARARGANILIVSEKILAAISRRDNPQMVIGVFRQRWHEMEEMASGLESGGDVILALDRVRDPGNLGTIIRTADSAGVKGIVLIGETTDPFSMEATRATMGSIFQVPLARMEESTFVKWVAGFKGRVVGTHLKGAVDYRSIAWQETPCVVVMGNEQQGLTEELAIACTDLAIIPMTGLADSLNLAIATGILLFEARRDNLKLGKAQKAGAL